MELLMGVLLLIAWQADDSEGTCCPRQRLQFKIRSSGDSCFKYSATQISPRVCTMYVCNNGIQPTRTHCGIDWCNFFKCDCRGGCFRGNAAKSFIKHNGGETRFVYAIIK